MFWLTTLELLNEYITGWTLLDQIKQLPSTTFLNYTTKSISLKQA